MLYFSTPKTNHFIDNVKKGDFMILCEELFFEIKLSGEKRELKKFINFLKSGELDDFFEITSDYIDLDDDYLSASDESEANFTFINDDYMRFRLCCF